MSPLGLNSEESPIPLKSINVDVQIFGNVAEVTSILTYYNAEETPVEAVFTFPVDDGSAVFQFEAHIDGRHIIAEIQEREQAQLTYDDAIESGKTAMLLKEDSSSGDIFSCMLGNLPAKSEASLVMKYVIELPQGPDGQITFTLPTVLNPRYSPDACSSGAAEGATYVPPSKVPYEFSLTAMVKGYHKVTSVTSDAISLNVIYEGNNMIAKVCLNDDFKFDHDLAFIVQYESPYLPQIVLEDGNPEADGLLKEDILMINFHPDLKEIAMATNGEYIFVIDRSGSMMGDLIANAKEALFLFLKSLPTNCYFNIVSFGSEYSSLFSSGSKKYTEESLNEAIKLQSEMDADMGGTEILKPLQHVFSKKPKPEHPRRIFVLTDGGVSNTDIVIGLIRKESKRTSTRVFTLGIGYGVSTSLVKGMARNGAGKSEFIAGEERIQPKVISLLKCAMQPAITEISLDWDLPPGITPVSIPTELPEIICAGERLTVFAILQNVIKDAIYAPSTMTLKGLLDEKPVSHTLTFTLCEANDIHESAPVHRLATKLQIKLLQDQEAELDYFDSNSLEEYRKKIVSLSCQGNIISKYTSFVAVDTKGKKVEGEAVKQPCPVPTLSPCFSETYEMLSRYRLKDITPTATASYFSQDLNMESLYENLGDGPLRSAMSSGFSLCSSLRRMSENMDASNAPRSYPRNAQYTYNNWSPPAQSNETSNGYFLERSQSARVTLAKAIELCPDQEERKVLKKRMKKPSLFGCGPRLSNIFSKKSKKKNSPTNQESEQFSKPDEADDMEIDETNIKLGLDSTEVYSDDKMSEEDKSNSSYNNIRKKSIESIGKGPNKSTSQQKGDDMLEVIGLQQLHGQWNMSDPLLQLLGVTKQDVGKLTFSEDSDVVCTVLVVAWLRKQFPDRHEEWQMIETKALAWISSHCPNFTSEEQIKHTISVMWTS